MLNPTKGTQRELKFRTWDDKAQGFIHFNILSAVQIKSILSQNLNIQQFSGLKDAHGTEIYEGDVIRTIRDTETAALWSAFFPSVDFPIYTHGVVEFVHSGFCLCQEGLGRTPLDKLSCASDPESINPSLEIIGNIFTETEIPYEK